MSQSDWPQEGRRPENSDRYSQRPPDDWGGAPAPPSGMSGGMKACLIVICVVGFCCVVCCGVFGYVFYTIGKSITEPIASKNPAEVKAGLDDICKITLPPGLEPKSVTKIDNFVFSTVAVEYENPGHASLMMLQMHTKMGSSDSMAPVRQQFEQKRVTHISTGGPMTNTKIETRILKIKGQDCTFTFTKSEPAGGKGASDGAAGKAGGDKAAGDKGGTDKVGAGKFGTGKGEVAGIKKPSSRSERESIHGDFDGKDGLVLIAIDFDDTYKEADIVKMLESIQ
jgi:hypothetical protein